MMLRPRLRAIFLMAALAASGPALAGHGGPQGPQGPQGPIGPQGPPGSSGGGTSGVPVNTALPTISGTPGVGKTLTANPGTWTNCSSCTFSYQWTRAAPMPDVSNFAASSGSLITVGGLSYGVENASQPWSITNPDSQTLVYEVRSGDQWAGDIPNCCNRSEIDGTNTRFTPGTEVNVSYNFTMTSTTARSNITSWFTIGDFHNADDDLGGSTSAPFEIDLQPNDQMSLDIGWLTAHTSSVPTLFSETVNGVNISYGIPYTDPNPIMRGHTYAMRIQAKMHPTAGFLNVWRDGVQIVNYSGPLGFNFNTYWKNGIYRKLGSDDQVAKYQNLIVTQGPYSLGTASTYTAASGDSAVDLVVSVTATNSAGAGVPVTSAPVGPVQ
jgi:hypothetical protein